MIIIYFFTICLLLLILLFLSDEIKKKKKDPKYNINYELLMPNIILLYVFIIIGFVVKFIF